MPVVSSITPPICGLPNAPAPKLCATAGIPHAALVQEFALMFMVRRIEVDYFRPAHIDEFADRAN